ncbi:PIG-L family deacetylase [Acuticoccus sp. M5D2P5]|uniref:PIG-L deacetylase family protein n=1 Tax=Acuticoccus kalidii TaxID=2910977 RepID=UPI001F45C12B|nr:PIG-L family deacetylase [Acuticoccus kalidii]MCF3934551.1 PIG-L family deacetylase [Acuticoccus kalidii]
MSVPTSAAGAFLDRAATRPAVSIADLLGPGDGLLVIVPHPDDETLGCGAALVAALARKTRVTIVRLTDGEGSHPRSRRYPREVLKALRREEFDKALGALAAAVGAAPPQVMALALPDTGVAAHVAEAAASLADLRFGSLWCTWRGDPHGDHVAAAAIADAVEAAARRPVTRFDYAVWGRFGTAGADLDPARIRPFPPGPHAAAKAAAMAHYRSQLTPLIDDDPNGFMMPPALTRHFAEAPEFFVAPA